MALFNQTYFKSFRAEYGAALWAFVFALLHLAWAAGWYIGLDKEQAQKAFQQNWFWIYNIAATFGCFLGVVAVLGIMNSHLRFIPCKLLILLVRCGTILLILRGLAGIVKFLYLVVAESAGINMLALWDIWFCFGAILFCLMLWQLHRFKNSEAKNHA